MPQTADLYALIIRLRPLQNQGQVDARGHGAQALFLRLIQQVDPELSSYLHNDAKSRPFTVAVIPQSRNQQQECVELRVTFCQAELFEPISRALSQHDSNEPLRLGHSALRLHEVIGEQTRHPWAGFGSFGQLAGNVQSSHEITLEFTTPTAIGQGVRNDGRQRLALLPNPELIFPSIARRWNEFAPTNLYCDPELLEAATRDCLVSRHQISTTQIHLGKGPQKGFIGQCTYELPKEPQQAYVLNLLADAVFYLGVGMKTARGMGLCRRVVR
jgi:CRISPR-associated endoribonuclease Cas6